VTKANFGFYKRTQHRLNSIILEFKKALLLAENQLKIGAIGSTLEHEPKEPPKLKTNPRIQQGNITYTGHIVDLNPRIVHKSFNLTKSIT
jgi:hypothetical protein